MDGFSPDGFITDQDCFEDYRYRTMQASINGCGPIAVYNILRFLGRGIRFEIVLNEMDRMHSLRIPGPTTMPVMRAYLKKHLGVPHFVSFFRSGGGFRFFNVNDGLEDYVCSMEGFFERHIDRVHYVSVFTLED